MAAKSGGTAGRHGAAARRKAKEAAVGAVARVLFYPTLLYNVVRSNRARSRLSSGGGTRSIREHILWEDDIYSLQSWKGTEYNNCLVLYDEVQAHDTYRSI